MLPDDHLKVMTHNQVRCIKMNYERVIVLGLIELFGGQTAAPTRYGNVIIIELAYKLDRSNE